ncbi:hypothetical protein KSP35_16215 [Aquihabitans sp. G128]|nr:hypothetical protein [Aquihabitans sp. G128]QXC63619.1 hypothetical protein KSP35_16215 [Aquihabitans sp. G128]
MVEALVRRADESSGRLGGVVLVRAVDQKVGGGQEPVDRRIGQLTAEVLDGVAGEGDHPESGGSHPFGQEAASVRLVERLATQQRQSLDAGGHDGVGQTINVGIGSAGFEQVRVDASGAADRAALHPYRCPQERSLGGGAM